MLSCWFPLIAKGAGKAVLLKVMDWDLVWFTVEQTFERNQVMKRSIARLFCGLICSVGGLVLEEYPVVSSSKSLKSMRYPRNIRKRTVPLRNLYSMFYEFASRPLFFVFIQLDGNILQKILHSVASFAPSIYCFTHHVTACDHSYNCNRGSSSNPKSKKPCTLSSKKIFHRHRANNDSSSDFMYLWTRTLLFIKDGRTFAHS